MEMEIGVPFEMSYSFAVIRRRPSDGAVYVVTFRNEEFGEI